MFIFLLGRTSRVEVNNVDVLELLVHDELDGRTGVVGEGERAEGSPFDLEVTPKVLLVCEPEVRLEVEVQGDFPRVCVRVVPRHLKRLLALP